MPVKHAFQSAVADGGDTSLVRPSDWNASHVITALELPGDISPTQLTADTNDYNPTGLADAAVLLLSSDRKVKITGLAGGADGRVLFVYNIGDHVIVMPGENTGSTAANRFAVPNDIELFPTDAVLLQYDGTASRWRAMRRANPAAKDVLDISDDFIAASVETGEIGTVGWNYSNGGTPALGAASSEANHPGIISFQTNASINSTVRVHTGSAANMSTILSGDVQYLASILKITTITTVTVRFGLGTDLISATFGNDGAWFEFDAAADASWRCYTRAGGTSEGPTDSAVDVVAGNWYLLEIYRDAAGNWDFYINENRVAHHTTQKPTGAVNMGWYITNTAASARAFLLDWFRITMRLGQRYT